MPKSVVSISLGYGVQSSIDDTVEEAVAAGIVIAASAGNDDGDACTQSPSRSPGAISVGELLYNI